MKLIYKVIIRVSLAMLIIMSLWGVLVYWAMVQTIRDQIDDSLSDYSEQLIINALTGEPMPSEDSGTNNQYYIEPISPKEAESRPQVTYKDTEVYIFHLDEVEPSRVMETVFQNEEGQYFLLTAATPAFKNQQISTSLLSWTSILYLCMLVTFIIINATVFIRCLRPFYVFMHWLDNYNIDKHSEPLKADTKIVEYNRLYDIANRTIKRTEDLFNQQRRFTSDAAHELQTPLAICINRVEMMLEDETLRPEQIECLAKVLSALRNAVKLNKAMLLLARIENGQFLSISTDMSLKSILDKVMDDYQSIYSYKDIHVEIKMEEDFVCNINEDLAYNLVTNLLKNAFVHTDSGRIIIDVNSNYFKIINGPDEKALDANRIFERFQHGDKDKKESTGLGLAIVHSICEQFELKISYSFEDGYHVFKIEK